MSSLEDETSKKCWFSYVNGHDLLTNNSTGLSQRKLLVRGFCRGHKSFIPVAIYGLCFKWYHIADDRLDAVRVNTIDMEFKSILQHKLVYKDTMYQKMLMEWSGETGIPLHYLTVYNYTERRNKTIRPNRQIVVDLGEVFKGDGKWTPHQVEHHLIETKETMNRITSMHHRIGNVVRQKTSFLLLDERRITTLMGPQSECFERMALVALKYFDFLEQKMYFVDWLRITVTTSTTFGHIAKYVAKHLESNLIPSNKSNGGRLHSLFELNLKLNEFEAKSDCDKVPKFCFYEEEAALSNKDNQSDPLVKIKSFNIENLVDFVFNGDIIVFQINPFHPFFALKPAFVIEIRRKKRAFHQKGMHWYCAADEFIRSQAHLTDIEIKIREETRWRRQWAKALMRQYMSTSDKTVEGTAADLEIRKKMIRSSHQWRIDSRTTFGMIRRRLGSYYNIKPEHFEIWIPQRSSTDQWNYGCSGRGQWNKPLSDLLKQRREWRQHCPLKFEIVAYNVKDFDEMTEY